MRIPKFFFSDFVMKTLDKPFANEERGRRLTWNREVRMWLDKINARPAVSQLLGERFPIAVRSGSSKASFSPLV